MLCFLCKSRDKKGEDFPCNHCSECGVAFLMGNETDDEFKLNRGMTIYNGDSVYIILAGLDDKHLLYRISDGRLFIVTGLRKDDTLDLSGFTWAYSSDLGDRCLDKLLADHGKSGLEIFAEYEAKERCAAYDLSAEIYDRALKTATDELGEFLLYNEEALNYDAIDSIIDATVEKAKMS